jgi:Pretoxin HINT domain
MELIRPRAWVEANRFEVGAEMQVNLPELQIAGRVRITAIDDCPEILDGDGSVVTGRFITREVSTIARVEILGSDGTIETLEGTPIHPIWSLDREDWVTLGELVAGERLQGKDGTATVLSIDIHNVSLPVYNIEVHGEHVYEVGELGVLVHNVCHWDLMNIGEHALHASKNWHLVLGNIRPTLQNIQPFVDDVLAKAAWVKVGVAHGPNGAVIGDIVQATHNGVYVRGLIETAGRVIVNNAGVIK